MSSQSDVSFSSPQHYYLAITTRDSKYDLVWSFIRLGLKKQDSVPQFSFVTISICS